MREALTNGSRRRVGIITTTRADYGLLYSLIREIAADDEMSLQLLVGGTHLLPEYGSSGDKIFEEFSFAKPVNFFTGGTTPLDMARSVGSASQEIATDLSSDRPDVFVILGDRYEMLGAGIAAMCLRIPIAHIHGGESTEGAIDEPIRHSLTKMALYHFTTTDRYRDRVIQLGEDPERVFAVGAPGLDFVRYSTIPSRVALEEMLGFALHDPFAVITIHPETLGSLSIADVEAVLGAVVESSLSGVITGPNSDAGGDEIRQIKQQFCRGSAGRFHYVEHLGSERYLGLMSCATMIIGNSSSGIIEAPSFGLPVINIGARQRGRERGVHVMDVAATYEEVTMAIQRSLDPALKSSLQKAKNPYEGKGEGTVAYRIKEQLKSLPLSQDLLAKRFFDVASGGS